MDTSTKHPMTYEQARHLFLNMGEAIKELEPNVDKLAQTLSHIENINMMDNYTLNVTKNALTCQLTISLIHLDLCAATRQYLSGLTNYDQRFAIKNLQAILNEAYKRVFGFSSTKLKDTLIYPLISSLSDEDKDKYRSYLDKMASIKSNFLCKFIVSAPFPGYLFRCMAASPGSSLSRVSVCPARVKVCPSNS